MHKYGTAHKGQSTYDYVKPNPSYLSIHINKTFCTLSKEIKNIYDQYSIYTFPSYHSIFRFKGLQAPRWYVCMYRGRGPTAQRAFDTSP